MRDTQVACKVLERKLLEKQPFARPVRWMDNVEINIG
jgi:hypothetical protein